MTLEFVGEAAKTDSAELESFLQVLQKQTFGYRIKSIAEVLFGIVKCKDFEPAVLERMVQVLEDVLHTEGLWIGPSQRAAVQGISDFIRKRAVATPEQLSHPLFASLTSSAGSASEREMRILLVTYSFRFDERHEPPDERWFRRFDLTGREGVEVLLGWVDIKPYLYSDHLVEMLGMALDRFPIGPELRKTVVDKIADKCLEPNSEPAILRPALRVLDRHANTQVVERLLPLLDNESLWLCEQVAAVVSKYSSPDVAQRARLRLNRRIEKFEAAGFSQPMLRALKRERDIVSQKSGN